MKVKQFIRCAYFRHKTVIEQIAKSAQDQAEMAQNLNEMISKFKL